MRQLPPLADSLPPLQPQSDLDGKPITNMKPSQGTTRTRDRHTYGPCKEATKEGNSELVVANMWRLLCLVTFLEGCLKNSPKPEVARITAVPQRALSSDGPSPIL
jgi:hypothetical protein